MSYDLSKELKITQAKRVKAHIAITSYLRDDPNRYASIILFFDKLFLEMTDNYWFWVTLRNNDALFEYQYHWSLLIEYYDSLQEWYYQWRKQEFNEDVWINFSKPTLPYEYKKLAFWDFWKILGIEAVRVKNQGSYRSL